MDTDRTEVLAATSQLILLVHELGDGWIALERLKCSKQNPTEWSSQKVQVTVQELRRVLEVANCWDAEPVAFLSAAGD